MSNNKHGEEIEFRDPSINLYVKGAEKSAAFYRELFGFRETFRTPDEGIPDHIELKKDNLTIGFATYDALYKIHNVMLKNGPAKGEVVLWTDDVDVAFGSLTARGALPLSEPHDFIDVLRSAWLQDPDGNNIQIVSRKQTDD